MADPLRGVVPGNDVADAAVRLAGALAELSEVRIEVREGGRSRVVDARKTDLPGLIRTAAAAGSVELTCLALGIRVAVRRDRLEWRADDAETARRFASALSSGA